MNQNLIPIVGPISAAIIAGSITFIVTVLSKEQKTSEFRQAWIDSLRTDIADFAGLFNTIMAVVRLKLGEDNPIHETIQYLLKKEDEFIKLETLTNRIKLRSNPDEHKDFLAALQHINDIGKDINKMKDKDLIKDLTDNFILTSNSLLRKEWKRVKRGEVTFQVTKWTSLAIFFAASFIGGLYMTNHITVTFL